MLVETQSLAFYPPIPSMRQGELKDMAQEVVIASSRLDGRIAEETGSRGQA
ncbi:MAG: hypothetical protein ABIF87_07595 [Pseudomonadota bacterium]